jgi:hypothetical protein
MDRFDCTSYTHSWYTNVPIKARWTWSIPLNFHCALRYIQYNYRYLRNNSTVFEELSVSIVDLTVANAVLLATRNSPSVYTLVWKHTNKWRNICTFQIPSAKKIVRQIHNWHRQLFKYSTVIPILMKFSQRVQTSLKTYK